MLYSDCFLQLQYSPIEKEDSLLQPNYLPKFPGYQSNLEKG